MSQAKRLAEIDTLFQAVLEAGPEHESRLLAAKADDPDLVREVRSLLRFDSNNDTTVISKEAEALVRLRAEDRSRIELTAGHRIGAYSLIRPIGRGGMGVVWLGERADGVFQQRVAIKVLPASSFSAEAIGRFERERQILANLSHDNIARLLDGGVDEEGRPFLVMELVQGQQIVDHCDAAQLSIPERLRLVISACRAVQTAHRNLIVHCDLKPANILVSDQGVPKLLDFGIAELVGPGEFPTIEGELRRLTPEYASPESLRGSQITTQSDVYQLGLLLYELVSGHQARAGVDPLHLLDRELSDHLFPTPSERLLGPEREPSASEISLARKTSASRLRRQLKGDLDAVIMKALALDPNDRYSSADELANDLERQLSGHPVQARGSSWSYRTGKLIRRHPAVFLLVLLLAVAAVGLVFQTRVATRERDRAEQEAGVARDESAKTQEVSDFLVSMLNDASFVEVKEDLTVLEMLNHGVARTQEELSDRPSAQAELEEILGRVYLSLGRPEESLGLLEDAVARKRALEAPPFELTESLIHLATTNNSLGNHLRTKELLYEALELQRLDSRLGTQSQMMADSLSLLSYVHGMLGELDPMLALRRESLSIRQELWGPNSPQAAQGLNDLCFAYKDIGDYQRAKRLCEQAIVIRNQHDLADLAFSSINNLAFVEVGIGDFKEADRQNRRALDWVSEFYPPDHPRVGRVHLTRGLVLVHSGRLHEANQALATARKILLQSYSPENRLFALVDIMESLAKTRSGEPEAAELQARSALTLLRRNHGENQHLVLQCRIALAEALRAMGRDQEAIAELQDAEYRLRVGRLDGEMWLVLARRHLAELGSSPIALEIPLESAR